jgi:hypothetical protein
MVRQGLVFLIQGTFGHFVVNDVTDKTIHIDLIVNGYLTGFFKDLGVGFALQAKESVATAVQHFRMLVLFKDQGDQMSEHL